jgi:hypothetical protein
MKSIRCQEDGTILRMPRRSLSGLLTVVTMAVGIVLFADCISGAVAMGISDETRREIADPCLGSHWQLIVDAAHPGWPGKLILKSSSGDIRRDEAGTPATGVEAPPAIRVGDQVTVNQSSPVLHAQFQAIALQSASVGGMLKVRLMAGKNMPLTAQGAVIAVLAEGVKQARWLTAGELTAEGLTR